LDGFWSSLLRPCPTWAHKISGLNIHVYNNQQCSLSSVFPAGQDEPACPRASRALHLVPRAPLPRLVPRVPTTLRCSCLVLPAPCAACSLRLTSCDALHCTSRLPPRLAPCTDEVRPPRRGIKLCASVKLCVNERPLGAASR
jgi:hypothetical protein